MSDTTFDQSIAASSDDSSDFGAPPSLESLAAAHDGGMSECERVDDTPEPRPVSVEPRPQAGNSKPAPGTLIYRARFVGLVLAHVLRRVRARALRAG